LLRTLAVVLLVFWALEFVTSSTMGEFTHLLLVVAVVRILLNRISRHKRA